MLKRAPEAINQIDGFEAFLRAWDDPRDAQNRVEADVRPASDGQISSDDIAGSCRGYVLSRWHPRFVEALEAGVRDLVIVLATQLDWITYSSCEGHPAAGPRGVPAVRHAGVFPRSDAERDEILRALRSVAAAVNRRHRSSPVRLTARPQRLDTESGAHTAVVIVFCRRRGRAWRSYFAGVDALYHDAVSTLRRAGPGTQGSHPAGDADLEAAAA